MSSIIQFVESQSTVCWRTTALGHVELTSTVGLSGISPCGSNFSPLMCMGTCIFTTIPISIHLNFSSLFCMYHLTHTTNMYLSNTHTFSSSYLSYRQLPTYSMIQSIYYSMLDGPIYMISSWSYDIISSTF